MSAKGQTATGPLTDLDLTALLGGPESARVERKREFSAREGDDAIRRAVCAFANDLPGLGLPGVLFLGVDDFGRPAGLKVTDKLSVRMTDSARDGSIQPVPSVEVRTLRIDDAEVLALIVQPSRSPPVRWRDRIFVRVGPSTREAGREDELRLLERRRFLDRPFDCRPVAGFTLDALAVDRFEREYLPFITSDRARRENRRPVAQKLASAGFCELLPEATPTAAGLIAVGRQPSEAIPGAYVQFVRHAGPTLASPLKSHEDFRGSLLDLVPAIEMVFEANNEVRVVEDGGRRIDRPQYPPDAFRQLFWNAIIHRDYQASVAPIYVRWFSDRIEIQNPGGLVGGVTELNLGEGVTEYRNLRVAEAMKNLGYAERFGRGIPIAREAARENGNPEPRFADKGTHFVATLVGG